MRLGRFILLRCFARATQRLVFGCHEIIGVAMAEGSHLFPFRTEKLSPPAPMVLPGRPGGRVGRRPIFLRRAPVPCAGALSFEKAVRDAPGVVQRADWSPRSATGRQAYPAGHFRAGGEAWHSAMGCDNCQGRSVLAARGSLPKKRHSGCKGMAAVAIASGGSSHRRYRSED